MPRVNPAIAARLPATPARKRNLLRPKNQFAPVAIKTLLTREPRILIPGTVLLKLATASRLRRPQV